MVFTESERELVTEEQRDNSYDIMKKILSNDDESLCAPKLKLLLSDCRKN